MFVCICNAFTDADVQRAVQTGQVARVSCVYRHNQCAAQCGRCAPEIKDMLVEAGVLRPSNRGSESRMKGGSVV